MNKESLRGQILAALAKECENITRAALDARAEAIDPESRPENKYDMHSQEAAYLAEGQARLAADLQASLTAYQVLPLPSYAGKPAGVGAVVGLEQKGRTQQYFLGPRSGGLEFDFEGQTHLVITPQSPLGGLINGKRVGDQVKMPARGTTQVFAVVSVE